jgi:hypothetical protein
MRLHLTRATLHNLVYTAMMVTGCIVFASDVMPHPGSRQAEEQSLGANSRDDSAKGVYVAVIDHFLGEHPQAATVVLCTVAESLGMGSIEANSPKFPQLIKQSLPETTTETIEQFQKSLSRATDLPPVLGEDPRWIFATREEIDDFSPGFEAWARFHEIYPTAIGISYFSAIGFNGQGDQALVTLSTFMGRHAFPRYYLVTRDDGDWHVKDQWSN